MKFANNLLHLYLRHFSYKDSFDSLDLFIDSILEQMDHQDLMEILKESPREELEELMRSYLNNYLPRELKQEVREEFTYQEPQSKSSPTPRSMSQ